MKLLNEWLTPTIAFLIWAALIFIIVPPLMGFLRRRAERAHHLLSEIV